MVGVDNLDPSDPIHWNGKQFLFETLLSCGNNCEAVNFLQVKPGSCAIWLLLGSCPTGQIKMVATLPKVPKVPPVTGKVEK